MKAYMTVYNEFKRNIFEFLNTNIYIIGVFLFVILALYSSSSIEPYYYKYLNNPLPIDYFYYMFSSQFFTAGGYLIMLIISAIPISEDLESMKFDIAKTSGLKKGWIVVGKYLWLLLYSFIVMFLSICIYSVIIFNKYIQFNTTYITDILPLLGVYMLLMVLIIMQGMLFSSIFSKRISAVLASLSSYFVLIFSSSLIVNQYLSSTSVYQPHMNKMGYLIVSSQFPFWLRVLYSLGSGFQNFVPVVLNFFSINEPNDECIPTNSSAPSFNDPLLMYGHTYMYFLIYGIFIVALMTTTFIVLKYRNRVIN